MNVGAAIAAIAFGLFTTGGFPLLLIALVPAIIWILWPIFQKEPESNGWCRDLQREIEEKRRQQS